MVGSYKVFKGCLEAVYMLCVPWLYRW